MVEIREFDLNVPIYGGDSSNDNQETPTFEIDLNVDLDVNGDNSSTTNQRHAWFDLNMEGCGDMENDVGIAADDMRQVLFDLNMQASDEEDEYEDASETEDEEAGKYSLYT